MNLKIQASIDIFFEAPSATPEKLPSITPFQRWTAYVQLFICTFFLALTIPAKSTYAGQFEISIFTHTEQVGLIDTDWNATPDVVSTDTDINYLSISDFPVGTPSDYFSMQAEGWFYAATAGTYTFRVASDDGTSLYIDGVQIYNDDLIHGVVTSNHDVVLSAGNHHLDFRYFEAVGGESVVLDVKAPGESTFSLVTSHTAPTVVNTIPNQSATEDVAYNYVLPTSYSSAIGYAATELPSWLSLDTAAGTLSGIPDNDVVGDHTVSIIATDNTGASTIDSFLVSVLNVNDPPTIDLGIYNQRAFKNKAFSYTISNKPFSYLLPSEGAFDEVDANDSLSYTILSGPSWLSLSGGIFSGTPTTADVGTTTVTVQAADLSGAAVTDSFDLLVLDEVEVANTDRFKVSIFAHSKHAGLANTDWLSTPDIVSYAANINFMSINDFPSGTPSDFFSMRAEGLFFAETAGTYTFRMSSDDGTALYIDGEIVHYDDNIHGVAVYTQDVALTVGFHVVDLRYIEGNGGESVVFEVQAPGSASFSNVALNAAPTVASSVADQNAIEDTPFNFEVPLATFSDVDASDTLTYSATTLPNWLSFNTATRMLSGTPSNDNVGDHTIAIEARDLGNAAVSDSFIVSVTNVNDVPTVANPVADQVATEGSAFSFELPLATFEDVDDGDSLSFSSTTLPSWINFNPATRTLSGTPSNSDIGHHTVTLQAADTGTATASLSFSVQVVPNAVTLLVDNLPTNATELRVIGLTDVNSELELQYNAALAAASPLPEALSELQMVIDQVNGVAELLIAAKQANTETSGPDQRAAVGSLLNILIGGAVTVPEALLPELAAAIDRADPAPATGAELIAITEALLKRADSHPVVYLVAEQGGKQVQSIQPSGGFVTFTVRVKNPSTGFSSSFDWSASGAKVLDQATEPSPVTNTLTIDPTTFSTGTVIAPVVSVTRNALHASATLRLPIALEENRDSDGDGVLDSFEGELEASTNAATANQLQTVAGDDSNFVMQANSGTVLRLGAIARAATANQSDIDLQDILDHSPGANAAAVIDTLPDRVTSGLRQVFDFEVAALPRVGASVDVVLPLAFAMRPNASYLKYHPAIGWQPFVEDGLNRLASAPAAGGVLGQCPPADHETWHTGLQSGYSCMRLTLEDGGPNDADRLNFDGSMATDRGLNGKVQDPGTLVFADSGALNQSLIVKTGLTGTGSLSILGVFGFFWFATTINQLARRHQNK